MGFLARVITLILCALLCMALLLMWVTMFYGVFFSNVPTDKRITAIIILVPVTMVIVSFFLKKKHWAYIQYVWHRFRGDL